MARVHVVVMPKREVEGRILTNQVKEPCNQVNMHALHICKNLQNIADNCTENKIWVDNSSMKRKWSGIRYLSPLRRTDVL